MRLEYCYLRGPIDEETGEPIWEFWEYKEA